MKKYFIAIAVAALALSACSKVETKSETAGQKPISFEVANYMHHTKGNEAFDTQKSFYTYAWAYTAGQTEGQVFMNNAKISYNPRSESPAVWAPEVRDYYWPKTGYVNFFSYAFAPAPTINENGSFNYGTATSLLTIAEDADPLLASAAYRYSDNVNQVTVTAPSGVTDPAFTGVPTLFHHMLSKVTVQVKFDASTADQNYTFTVTVNNAKLSCAEKGYLSSQFVAPANNATGMNWPFEDKAVNWIPEKDANDVVVLADDKILPASGTGPVGNKDFTKTTTDAFVVWDGISVLPQALNANQKLELSLTLSTKYGTDPAIVEDIDLTGDNAISLYTATAAAHSFGTTIDAWNMGYKYTYTVTIKPNKKLTFDPAVVEWASEAEQTYTWPEATN